MWFLFTNLCISSCGDVSLKALLTDWQVWGFFFFQIQQLFPLMPGRTLPGYRVPRDGERVHMEISSGQIQVTERVGGGAQKSPAGSLCLRTVDAEGHT